MTLAENSGGVGWGSRGDASKRALEYIEAHLESQIEIRKIAKLVALSKSHFSRTFKRSVGFSPRAYVSARRVERAKLMMRSTSERLADIAAACGFTDQSHLNRHFRLIVGTSPGVWRRASKCAIALDRIAPRVRRDCR